MSYRTRALFIAGMITVAGAAYATARWQPWSPVSTCLLCDTRSTGSAAVGTTGSDPLGGSAAGSLARSSTGAGGAGALGPVPLAPGSDDGTASRSHLGSGRRGWQPWAAGSGTFRIHASSASSHDAPLGGLWRLMSLSRPGTSSAPEATHAAAHSVNHPTAAPAAPVVKKPRPPSSSPAPGAPSAGTIATEAPAVGAAAPAVGAAPAVDPGVTPAPTDTFHDHQNPPPDPFGGGGAGGGGFDPGSTGGGRPAAGGGVSATPEPGSVLLVGTGLLGMLGVLRRRRLI